jgi:Chain length determinant protein
MDLVSIIREAWKGKWVVLPVVFLTLLGAAYVLVVRPPQYASDSALTLLYPPAAPTPSQIASDPALGKVNASNPYAAYGDLTVVDAVVQQAMGGEGIVDQLRKEGVEDGYNITPDATTTNPILHVQGVGATPAAALRATTILGQQIETTLNQLQANQHVADHYRITAQVLSPPSVPRLKISSKLRSLIAVLVAGVIMMFIALSIRRGIVERKLAKRDAWAGQQETGELAARRKSHRFVARGSVGASELHNGSSTKTRGVIQSTGQSSSSSSE